MVKKKRLEIQADNFELKVLIKENSLLTNQSNYLSNLPTIKTQSQPYLRRPKRCL